MKAYGGNVIITFGMYGGYLLSPIFKVCAFTSTQVHQF